MDIHFSVIGNATAAVSFTLLSVYILRNYSKRYTDRALLLASSCSAIWLTVLCVQSLGFEIPFTARYTLELLRTASWFVVLYSVLGVGLIPNKLKLNPKLFFTLGVISLIFGIIVTLVIQAWFELVLISGKNLLILNILIALIGILLLEQIWRNSALFTRSGIKYLSLAVSTILAYDFVMYSDALLFKHLSGGLWDARGAVNTLATPLIAATILNAKGQALGIHLSRQMVFHTSTLVLAGIYLLFVSAGGYYINLFGGSWGEALRVLFIFSASVFMILVFSSPALRARTMVFITKNFFDYKYDYRDEWIKSTSSLQQRNSTDTLALRSAKTLAEIVDAQGGAIWGRDEEGKFALRAQFGFEDSEFLSIEKDSDLATYFENTDWIINLNEYLIDPEKYHLIELPYEIINCEQPWLIIPLKINEQLSGLVLLARPYLTMELNWENYDLLRIVAQQACSYIEQQSSEERLAQSLQFEAVNQTSAFLVHDIKTIIAQLSLLVKNAPKHKQNPAFIDDMIETTRHSVEKMEHLLAQIRNPNQVEVTSQINICELLSQVCYEKKSSSPSPKLSLKNNELFVNADYQQLQSVIAHITQNAIEACDKNGSVEISLKSNDKQAFVFIQDNGSGMSQDFIQDDLFKPFSSTKGLTGMGIGAYQSREYLRKIGGSIKVTSEQNVGTCFTLTIPLSEPSANNKETRTLENNLGN